MKKQTSMKTLTVGNTAVQTACDAQSETSVHVNHCRNVDFSSSDLHRIYVIPKFVVQQTKQWHVTLGLQMELRKEPPKKNPPLQDLLSRSRAFLQPG